MNSLIEFHVRYRGSDRFLRLVQCGGEWTAGLMVPGKEDLLSEECVPRAPLGGVLPNAELDGMTFRIEAPAGKVVSLSVLRLVASGSVAVRDEWIEVPLQGIIRDYGDSKSDRIPEVNRAQILAFPPQKTKARDGGMER